MVVGIDPADAIAHKSEEEFMKTVQMESKLWLLVLLAALCLSSACTPGTAAAGNSTQAEETRQASDAARATEARRNQLRSDIAAAETERSTLTVGLETAAKSAGMYQLEAENCQQSIERQEIATKAFMMDHKAVVIAMATGAVGAVALNDPQLKDDLKGFSAFLTTLAVIYALGHLDEVAQVGDALMQADSHIKDLRAASERADQERENAESQMKELQAKIAGLDQKLGELRASLAAL